MRFICNRHTLFLALAVTVMLVAPAAGQCPGDDGLNIPGACCIPATPTLPAFPSASIPSEGCCFLDCNVDAVFPCNIFLNSPIPVFCDVFAIPISITGGASTQQTFMVAKYQRTWEEIDPVGIANRQVWRFLVNTDLSYNLTGSTPCPEPTCAYANLPVHFIGSVDYALDCVAGPPVWSVAINLTHLCDDFMHGSSAIPSFRPVPAAFQHPDRIYSFAGPAPFSWGVATPPQGSVDFEGQRSTQANLALFPPLWQCYSENPLIPGVGFCQTIQQRCGCGTTSTPAMFHDQDLRFAYGCTASTSSSFQPFPVGGLLPTGITAITIGTYAGPPFGYPGNESVSLYFGVAGAGDPCGFNLPIHIVTGVGTRGGHPALLFNVPGVVTDQFIDLENMLVFQPTPPYLFIGTGSLFLSTMTWGLNTI